MEPLHLREKGMSTFWVFHSLELRSYSSTTLLNVHQYQVVLRNFDVNEAAADK